MSSKKRPSAKADPSLPNSPTLEPPKMGHIRKLASGGRQKWDGFNYVDIKPPSLLPKRNWRGKQES